MADDTPITIERSLNARGSERVFQAAGDQYIYHHKRPPAPAAVSNTLPRDTAAFTGRDGELRVLIESVTDSGDMIPVHTIEGMPGVGKSALAVHAGHLLARRFPGGQFFINLHAHTAGQAPVRPTDALFELLCADGVESTRVPADLDARAALWRGRMAGKRVLLILDNAAGRWQVEHLLPGTAGCLVLITSRRRLTGLSAQHATATLSLDTLPAEQAATLFASMAGRSANGPEAAAINDLVRLCGFLPLAICLLAARLRPEPHWRVADLHRELSQVKSRSTRIQAEDVAVAAAFDLSYHLLPISRRRFFRRLGLHPGADLDAYAAAALDDIPPAKAERQLDALYEDHLLDQPVRGRYRMHDLISDYARDRADSDPERDRAQAVDRVLNHYRSGAQAADRYLSRRGSGGSAPASGAPPALPGIGSRQQALEWLDAERGNLFACAALLTGGSGPQLSGGSETRLPDGSEPRRIIELAAAMATYLRTTGPWEHAVWLHQAAADAAREAGERPAHADALRELGTVRRMTGDYASATENLQHAFDLYRDLDDDRGVADTLTQLAGVLRRTGAHLGALQELERALKLYQRLDDPHGQADALDELGVVRHLTDDYPGAAQTLRRALTIHRDLGDRLGQANALNQLGLAQQLTSEYPPAIQAHRQALAIYRELGDRHGQACALNYLGIALCHTGEHAAAKQALTEALPLHGRLGYPSGQANALHYLGMAHGHTGEHGIADDTLTRALALYRELGYQPGQADTLNQLGVLRCRTGEHQAAAQLHERALDMFRQLGDHLGEAEVLNELGALGLARDQPAQALDHFRLAVRLARQAHNPREEARSAEGLGRCSHLLGRPREAATQLRRAEAIYRRVGALGAARAVAGYASRVRGDGPPESIDALDSLEKSA